MFISGVKGILIVVVLSLLLPGCVELKKAGKSIGHSATELGIAIGHGTRDAAKSVAEGAREAKTEADKNQD
jgi:hypothetical protein